MREMGNEKMNKLISFFNKILEFINSFFKLIIIICIITYLIIYYQSTLNNRYQYHHDQTLTEMQIFDTKKGEIYWFDSTSDKTSSFWIKMSPFSKTDAIPVKYNVHPPSK
jgi:hypothetical protein